MHTITYILALIIFAVTPIACLAEPECIRGDMTAGLDKEGKAVMNWAATWMTDTYICDMGRYKIAVPAGEETPTIFVFTEKAPYFMYQDAVGLNVFGKAPEKY
ncbi:MAG TPA: hypothetical protein ENI76_09360, partial [Ignavibacteria bacterium]|nr:hypothetical protein [Ignavibacteria bacterium]